MSTFKGQSNLNQSSPVEIVCDNLQAWMNWSFLVKGGYTNIRVPTVGHRGGDWSRVSQVKDPNFADGQVWEGARKDWVWETGTGRDPEPIQVSGITINGTFNFFSSHTPAASNTIQGYVDYPNGRIVLGSGIATNVAIQAEYSYRWIHTYKADDVDLLREVQSRSYQVESPNYLGVASGDWSTHPESRVQLPAIIIEFANGNRKPYQLGGGHYSYNEYVCHILTENGKTADRLGFILSEQEEKTISAFNPNTVGASGAFPLALDGSVQSGALNYPSLASTYPHRSITIVGTSLQQKNKVTSKLYQLPVRLRTETILGENY